VVFSTLRGADREERRTVFASFGWLRSPANNSNKVANVNTDGTRNWNNYNNDNGGVRPDLPRPRPTGGTAQARNRTAGAGGQGAG